MLNDPFVNDISHQTIYVSFSVTFSVAPLVLGIEYNDKKYQYLMYTYLSFQKKKLVTLESSQTLKESRFFQEDSTQNEVTITIATTTKKLTLNLKLCLTNFMRQDTDIGRGHSPNLSVTNEHKLIRFEFISSNSRSRKFLYIYTSLQCSISLIVNVGSVSNKIPQIYKHNYTSMSFFYFFHIIKRIQVSEYNYTIMFLFCSVQIIELLNLIAIFFFSGTNSSSTCSARRVMHDLGSVLTILTILQTLNVAVLRLRSIVVFTVAGKINYFNWMLADKAELNLVTRDQRNVRHNDTTVEWMKTIDGSLKRIKKKKLSIIFDACDYIICDIVCQFYFYRNQFINKGWVFTSSSFFIEKFKNFQVLNFVLNFPVLILSSCKNFC